MKPLPLPTTKPKIGHTVSNLSSLSEDYIQEEITKKERAGWELYSAHPYQDSHGHMHILLFWKK